MPPRRRLRDQNDFGTESNSATRESAAPEPRSNRNKRGRRSEPQRTGLRWPRRLGILFLALVLLVALAPNIIGWLGMHQTMIDWGAKDFDGKISVARVSLGWFQPVVMSELKAVDRDGEPLAEIESVRSTNRLASFVFGSNLGNFEIVRPKVTLRVRPGGSNLEDAISNYTRTPAKPEPSSDLPPISITIVDASVQIIGSQANGATTLDKLNAKIQTAGTAAFVAEIDGELADVQNRGSFKATVQLDDKSKTIAGNDGSLNLDVSQLPLAALAPVLERVLGTVQLTGEINGQTNINFTDAGRTIAADIAQMTLVNAYVSAPRLIGQDTIQIQKLVANGKLNYGDAVVSADQFSTNCDFGSLVANGQFAWSQLNEMVARGQLTQTPFQLNGQLDLARIATIFPSTLRVYDDLQFESGDLRFQFSSKPAAGAGRMLVNVDTTNVVARRAGQRLAWQQPLRFVADVVQQGDSLKLQELDCRTDFLTANGSADFQSGSFVIQGDLAKLLERASQFVDVSGWQLAGIVDGKLDWQLLDESQLKVADSPSASNPIALVGKPIGLQTTFVISQPVLGMPGMQVWRDSELKLNGSGRGTTDGKGGLSLETAEAAVQIGTEQAQIKLLEPVANVFRQTRWPLDCTATGSLANWLRHVESFVDVGTFQAEGDAQFKTVAIVESKSVSLQNFDYDIKQLGFVGYGMKIAEQQIKGLAQAQFAMDTGVLTVSDVTLASSSVAARGEQIKLSYDQALLVAGQIGFRADVNRVTNWFGLSSAPDSIHYFGTSEGSIVLSSDKSSIGGTVNATIPELLAAQQLAVRNAEGTTRGDWKELLRETNVKLSGKLGLSQDFNQLTFKNLIVDCSSVGVKANGSIDDLMNSFKMDVAGTWSPQWEKANGLLAAYSYDLVQLAGKENQSFSIRGPLFSAGTTGAAVSFLPPDLEIQSQLGWERGEVCKLPLGPATVDLKMAGGMAALSTGSIPFSGGTIQLAPKLDMRGPSPVVLIDKGPVAENIALTPEICRDWMKYVAPLLADVTSAQGTFSLQTDGSQIPLDDPMAARVRGAVQLNNVTVGAGPVAQQLIGAVQGIRTLLRPTEAADQNDLSVWMKLDQQTVPFAIQDRRVHHEGLTLTMKDVTIRTKGSVGLDQSLSMVAEIPISESWLGNDPWLAGLKGQTLQIPIGGTVTKPVLDKNAIQQLSMQLIKRTAANQLNNVVGDQAQKLQSKLGGELDKLKSDVGDKLPVDLQQGLDKLFGPKRDK